MIAPVEAGGRGRTTLAEIISIVVGFVLTTVFGGYWASVLQQRSWERQNDLRLKEQEAARAAEVCHELTRLLDKRLYRMRRLYWATEAFQRDPEKEKGLLEKLSDYDATLYEWNERLNLNLALVGSQFGLAARQFLYQLYEHFRAVGGKLELAISGARKGEDTTSLLQSLDGEFEGWQEGSLNNDVYLLGLTMLTQMREGLVGRSAPDKLPLPSLRG
jgi:hypothetical protein